MIKKILFIIVCLIFETSVVFGMSLNETNTQTGYSLVMTDDAMLLSEDEIQMLKQDMYPLTDYGNIVFYSTQDGDRDYARKAHDYYYQHFQDNSGTLLLIDMYNRKVYIHSDGSNYSIITSGKAEIITDNIYRYLTNGQYYKGAQIAFSQALSLLER